MACNKKDFSIDAGTYTLKTKNRDKDYTILGNSNKYCIPIYQRPYSWTELQLKKFISDIFISYWGNDNVLALEPMFIGTMQISEKKKEGYKEIIDRQQRLSSLLVLLKVLSITNLECVELKTFSFDWLITRVNNGKQQEELDELINLTSLDGIEHTQNRYVENALLINSLVKEAIKDENADEENFQLREFLDHLYSNIYFVVIETKATLSKTLKIFDAINTTGLDLNTTDIFKIRMYEYLSKDVESEKAFNDISALYEKVDRKNKELGRNATDFKGILHIYQYFLIGKYKLDKVLYSYSTDKFYDHLFETLFNINKWEHFKGKVEDGKLVLDLKELDDLISVRYEWEDRWRSGNYGTAEDASLLHLWWMSRYGRFWILILIFLFKYKDDPNRFDKMFDFSRSLVKLYFIYSVNYKKIVNEIRSRFTYQLIGKVVNEDYEEIISFVNDKLEGISEHTRNKFKTTISGSILFSWKVKNLLCRLSALLEEDFLSTSENDVIDIREKLFPPNKKDKKTNPLKIEIEHIQSHNDENKQERADIKKEWGSDLHSLGNLVILEMKLNRSINNNESKKVENYKESKFKIVKESLLSDYDKEWTLDKCKARKNREVEKLIAYLFGK